MSDSYNCPYCGSSRHQLSPGVCPTCKDNPNFASDLGTIITKLENKCERLKREVKRLKDQINNITKGPNHLGQGI